MKAFRRIVAALLSIALVVFLIGVACLLGDMSEFDSDNILNAPLSLVVLDKDDNAVSDLFTKENRIWVSIEKIPTDIRNAFVAVEDTRFYEHNGYDVKRIVKAIYEDIRAGAYVQGASTISQQLVKLSHLNQEKVLMRKIEEILLACQMEEEFSKDEILEMYLNYVYFGGGYYGIQAAAKGYFGVNVSELSIAQGALLAGILKSPSNYAPHLDMEASVERRNLVLRLMHEGEFIDDKTYQDAVMEQVVLSAEGKNNVRDYYIDAALQESCEILNIDMESLLSGGYKIYTYMDTDLQRACTEMFEDDANFPQEDVEGALAVIAADNGGVIAMIGGREQGSALAFNRAVDIRRQPGSVIKPILVYAPALEYCDYTTVSMLLDTETDFNGYRPKNFNGKYAGWVTMREAVKKSLNIPAVSVLQDVGVKKAKEFAESIGIEFEAEDNSLTLALGGFTYGVSPLQMAGAYATFASGGVYHQPAVVRKIETANGEVVYSHEKNGKRVMSEANAYILTDMLNSVIQDGTGKRLADLNMSIAGKTGTTEDVGGNRDAWMAAYTSEYVAVAWMGYDSATNGQALPAFVTGGTYPAMLLKAVFETLYPKGDAPDFIMPDSVMEYRLDGYTLENNHVAVLANALTPSDQVVREVFAEGTEPTGVSSYWKVPSAPLNITVHMNATGRPVVGFTCPDTFILYSIYRETVEGESTLLASYPGSIGVVSFVDDTAYAGDHYSYYVVPEHPQLQIGGKRIVGPASRKVSIFIPKAGNVYQ